MHQATIFDNFHVFTACIHMIFNYILASRISINRVNLFVLWIIQFEVSLSICESFLSLLLHSLCNFVFCSLNSEFFLPIHGRLGSHNQSKGLAILLFNLEILFCLFILLNCYSSFSSSSFDFKSPNGMIPIAKFQGDNWLQLS